MGLKKLFDKMKKAPKAARAAEGRAARPAAVWATRDGRKIPVPEMTDTHLVHTIRAIREGRISGDELGGYFGPEACESVGESNRDRWLGVLCAEATKRGLDWTKPPTRREGLVSHVLLATGDRTGWTDAEMFAALDAAATYMKTAGLVDPQIDVADRGNVPTYMHFIESDYPTVPGVPVKGE